MNLSNALPNIYDYQTFYCIIIGANRKIDPICNIPTLINDICCCKVMIQELIQR